MSLADRTLCYFSLWSIYVTTVSFLAVIIAEVPAVL